MDKFEEYFGELETDREYLGYYYSTIETVMIAVLGSFCGLRNMKQIHQWAASERIRGFPRNEFAIYEIPGYSWFTQILGMISPKSFNSCFTKWVTSLIGGHTEDATIAIDGKTVRSTAKMKKYDNPLRIVSAQIAELGITLGQKSVEGKSNEIPAVRELIEPLNIHGCIIVADALNCQKQTAKTIVENGGDYLLRVKENQKTLRAEIADYIADETLRDAMDTVTRIEKSRDRIEERRAYSTTDVNRLDSLREWENACCVGAVNTIVKTPQGITNEWHLSISSRPLSAEKLLDRTRKEWSVETMRWLLDVHFGEDFCRVAEQNTQENLNIIRKIVLNYMRIYKTSHNSKSAFSHIMLDCLIEPKHIFRFL